MVATRPPPRSAFPFTAESMDTNRFRPLLSPTATKAVGVLVAVVLAIIGVLAVIVAASAFRTSGPVAWFSIAAAVGCGVVSCRVGSDRKGGALDVEAARSERQWFELAAGRSPWCGGRAARQPSSGRASGPTGAAEGGAEARRRGLVNIGNISASLLHRTDVNDYEPVPEGRFTGKIRRLNGRSGPHVDRRNLWRHGGGGEAALVWHEGPPWFVGGGRRTASEGLRLRHRVADLRQCVGLPDLFVQDPHEAGG